LKKQGTKLNYLTYRNNSFQSTVRLLSYKHLNCFFAVMYHVW